MADTNNFRLQINDFMLKTNECISKFTQNDSTKLINQLHEKLQEEIARLEQEVFLVCLTTERLQRSGDRGNKNGLCCSRTKIELCVRIC